MSTLLDLLTPASPLISGLMAFAIMAGTIVALRLMRFTDSDDEAWCAGLIDSSHATK
ncbi:MAG: hypothetical protein ABTQ26_00290 [Azonexus sp.]